jgi:hypothetical protein
MGGGGGEAEGVAIHDIGSHWQRPSAVCEQYDSV